jgi:hypothetical protein
MRHLKVALFLAIAAIFMMGMMAAMVGCGGDDDGDGEAPNMTGTNPADGATMNSGATLTINFDGAVATVTVNGNAAQVAGTKATWVSTGLSEGNQTLTIDWEDADGNTGTASITLTIAPEDKVPPEVTSVKAKKTGDNLDGATNVEPADLNPIDTGGIEVKFSEDVGQTGKFVLSEEGNPLKWIAEWIDEVTVVLTAGPDADLRHEGKYTLTISEYTDGSNDGAEKVVTFTMKGKEQ